MRNEPIKKLDYIDALRGIAVLGVILVHSQDLASSSSPIAAQGARGVQLFFVLSAFTLLLSMTSRVGRENDPIRNFFIRRFFRIAPLFYVALIVSLGFDGLSPRYWAPFGLHISDVVATVFFLNGWNAFSITSVVPGGWSIAVEMTFYCILPLLFYHVYSFKRSFAVWVAVSAIGSALTPIAASIAGSGCPTYIANSFESFWLPSQLPVFLSGFMLFFALRERFHPLRFVASQVACLLVLVAEFIVKRHFSLHWNLHSPTSVAGIVASGLVFTVARYKVPILVNRATMYIGKISYSGYVSQFWVIRFLLPAKAAILLLPAYTRLPIAYCGIAGGTILVSTLLHRFIEVPGQNIGRKLILHLTNRNGVTVNSPQSD